MFHVKHCPRETYCTLQNNRIKGERKAKKLISDCLSMCVYINYNVRIILGTIL